MRNPFRRKPRRDWLVWSSYHNAWWRPDRAGYTNHIAAAGRYAEDEAKAIERDNPQRNQARHVSEVRGQISAQLAIHRQAVATLEATWRECRR
jgi:hypothetical protein